MLSNSYQKLLVGGFCYLVGVNLWKTLLIVEKNLF